MKFAIYGDRPDDMREIARLLRIDKHVALLRSIVKWQGDLESVDHCILLDRNDELEAAIQAAGQTFEFYEDIAEPAPEPTPTPEPEPPKARAKRPKRRAKA